MGEAGSDICSYKRFIVFDPLHLLCGTIALATSLDLRDNLSSLLRDSHYQCYSYAHELRAN